MNTNKVTVSARLLFIRHDAQQVTLVCILQRLIEHRRVSNLGLYILRRGGGDKKSFGKSTGQRLLFRLDLQH